MSTPLRRESADLYAASASVPLCVDLDGTLVRSDLLIETILLLIKKNPLLGLLIPIWLLRGKAILKKEVSARVSIDATTLPYNVHLIQWLISEKTRGRQVWLCTASHYSIASAVAAHLRLFDGVIATEREVNLSGVNKAETLVKKFGLRCFDYCGNEFRDLAIWRVSRAAIVVNGNDRLLREVQRKVTVEKHFSICTNTPRKLLQALRPHQWTKNALIFVPLVAAHKLGDYATLATTGLAALAFCLCASSVYIANDLLDLTADRNHKTKLTRPFASGEVSVSTGLTLAPILLLLALAISSLLTMSFVLVLATYYLVTLAYSFLLKRLVLIDVVTLAILYTLRVVAGIVAAGVPTSFWLLCFSMFLFLSLAFVKRYAELDALHRHHDLNRSGRGYSLEDLPALQSLGGAAGYLSVVVLALYVNSAEINTLYENPQLMWLLCILLLYWISRVWIKAHRGEMQDDPVVFALRDRTSQALFVLAAVIFAAAI